MKRLALILALLVASPAGAAGAGLARTPPMGWNSWYAYHCGVTEQGVLANAQALVDTGLAARGYRFVNVDGCWEARHRTPGGFLKADPTTFPSGMAALGRKLHAMGLRFGLYTSAGPTICLHPQPGSYGHYKRDFRTFAKWKVDYVKVDWCSAPPHNDPVRAYRAIHLAARGAGRPMIVAVSTPGTRKPWRWARAFGQTWRIGRDANGRWEGVTRSLDADAPLWRYAGPGAWNDPDILQVGSGALSATEARAHFSLWAMLAAPLLAGHDLGSASAESLATLSNDEVIAIDQDPAGHQARRVRRADGIETWVKPLAGHAWAVLFLNRRTGDRQLGVRLKDVPRIPDAAGYTLRDVWAHASREVGASEVQQMNLAGHDAVVWRVTPR
ncbi:MAG: alpha-galactosidase [Thermoleophilaceae bacterium]|jgi:alpha-galactosidase|nr:alpha-galactosidase [Thermoleophilaceae bacterium]